MSETLYLLALVPPPDLHQQALDHQIKHGQMKHTRPRVEPHITIKFKAGLTPDLLWLDRVREVCEQTAPFPVHLLGVRTFGDKVLFWDVDAPEAKNLHLKVLAAVGHPPQPRFHEGEAYQMHLTLLYDPTPEQMEEAAAHFGEATFTASFLRLYSKKPGGVYQRVEDLPFLG